LAFLRAVNADEADAFRVLVVEDFEGIAVEDGDDGAGEVGIGRGEDETQIGCEEDEEQSYTLA
jgi:hypothetical protein